MRWELIYNYVAREHTHTHTLFNLKLFEIFSSSKFTTDIFYLTRLWTNKIVDIKGTAICNIVSSCEHANYRLVAEMLNKYLAVECLRIKSVGMFEYFNDQK